MQLVATKICLEIRNVRDRPILRGFRIFDGNIAWWVISGFTIRVSREILIETIRFRLGWHSTFLIAKVLIVGAVADDGEVAADGQRLHENSHGISN